MTAAIYARKSTEQTADAEDRSVTRQVENARAFAAAKGWTVDEAHIYVDDGISGAAALEKLRAKRRMLDAIHSGHPPFQVLVTQANDRLSRRDGDEALAELKAIAGAGVETWFYSDGTRFEFGTFASNTLSFLKGEFAAEYRRAVAAKTAEALRRKAALGYVAGGRTFGYDNVRVNSHTERRVNETEAAVVRRIYELYAAGAGLPTIAHTLNAEGAPAPRPQQGRVQGWCPSSVREALQRPLYRGVIVHGQTRKVRVLGRPGSGDDATWQQKARPESDWLTVKAPEFRIVPAALAEAVDARRASMRARSLRLSNGQSLGRPPGEGSPYLLTGLLTCGVCGGSMEVLSTHSGGRRRFHYRCYTARRKGPACCTNKLPAPMAEADAMVLQAVEKALMHPDVVDRALRHAERVLTAERNGDALAALQARLADTERAMHRLSQAIANGGQLEALVTALATQEAQRAELQARLSALTAPSPALDAPAVRAQLAGYLKDWRGFLLGQLPQAQQALRRLVKGRLTFMPHENGYTFEGVGTLLPLLGGVVRNLASPRRPVAKCTNPVEVAWIAKAA